MIVSMIVAQGPKGEIGLNNKLLWHIKEDLLNFKKITTGKMIVMGRKTFESIGKPLPNRTNIVITRDTSFQVEGVIVVNDPLMVFDLALEAEENLGEGELELIVCGGAEIYQIFMTYAQRIYLSEVPYQGEADAYFPPLIDRDWQELESRVFEDFKFRVLVRV